MTAVGWEYTEVRDCGGVGTTTWPRCGSGSALRNNPCTKKTPNLARLPQVGTPHTHFGRSLMCRFHSRTIRRLWPRWCPDTLLPSSPCTTKTSNLALPCPSHTWCTLKLETRSTILARTPCNSRRAPHFVCLPRTRSIRSPPCPSPCGSLPRTRGTHPLGPWARSSPAHNLRTTSR